MMGDGAVPFTLVLAILFGLAVLLCLFSLLALALRATLQRVVEVVLGCWALWGEGGEGRG